MSYRSVSTISCASVTVCINDSNDVLSFGNSKSGAHGFEEEQVFPPQIIPSLHNIVSISCSVYHTVCLDNEGNVFTFGSNY